jgi:hypothetical protein
MDRRGSSEGLRVKPKDHALAAQLDEALRDFDSRIHRLPGIRNAATRSAFLEQVLESIRRVRYVAAISNRNISPLRADPANLIFDPVRAAVLRKKQGQMDEAFWFVFVFVHFGKHFRDGWLLARQVYGALGGGIVWDWARTSANPRAFREWLAKHQDELTGRFGNHRKYESLKPWTATGTGAAVESYVAWVRNAGSHRDIIEEAKIHTAGDPHKTFDWLYRSMGAVARFGRTARFDYLTMVGKIGLAPIEPGSTYMSGATGPFSGGCLLFGVPDSTSRAEMDKRLVRLGEHLDVGMQAMEDALCNWQKSPRSFVRFRG